MMKRMVEITDFAKIRKLGGLTLSGDGRKAAFTVTRPDLASDTYQTEIWIYDPTRQKPLFRLTADGKSGSPLFLDQDTVAFTGDREKNEAAALPRTVMNRISLSGGESEILFSLPFSASELLPLGPDRWICLGTVDLAHPELGTLKGKKLKQRLSDLEEEKDYRVFDELPFWYNGRGDINKKRNALFLCDTAHQTNRKITPDLMDVRGYALDEARKVCVYWGDLYEHLDPMKSVMFIRDLESESITEVPLKGRYSVRNVFWIGEEIFFLASTGERYGTSENEGIYRLEKDGAFTLLCLPDKTFSSVGSDVAGSGSHWQGKDGWYCIETSGFRSFYERMSAKGEFRVLCNDLSSITSAAGTVDDLFFIGMDRDGLQELYRKKDGITTRLSSFNEDYLKRHRIARTEPLSFTDSDGIEIDGFVLYPPGFDPGKRYPAILTIHGGPRSVYGDGFFHEFQYWAACGYIVFFCNPRGSSGKGDSFADILGENFGIRDYGDIMEFTDHVLANVPQIDPEKVAVTGGSYGGFLTNWIIGHTDRFAAAVSCRSISNYFSKCLTTDIGFYHNLSQLGVDPWTDPLKMWKHSPLAYADRVKTPTLFIQSDEDYRCWMGDALQMLQALLLHGVPARMCLFKGENHELSRSGKPRHRVRRIREMTEWFDRYLKG